MGWGDIPKLALAAVFPQSYHALTGALDNMNTQDDIKQQNLDLSRFAKDPNYAPDRNLYNDPAKYDAVTKQTAIPSILDFNNQYEAITGTPDPRFLGDAENRAEVYKAGLKPPNMNNPKVAEYVMGLQQRGANEIAVKAANEGDPFSLAYVATDKDLASGSHLAAQAQDIPLKRADAIADNKRQQDKIVFDEAQKKAAEFQQSEFDRIRAGIGGRYQQAQPIVDGVTPTGPNVHNGLDYSDAQGKVTPRQIMPYDEAHRLITEAKADYPLANSDKAFSDLDKLYEGEHSSPDYTPTATNWKGNVTKDMTQLQYAAEIGKDPKAQRLLAAMQGRELAIAKAKAEDRRMTIVQNPLPSRVNVNELSPEQNAALTQAIAERRLDPYKVNSRNQQLLAQTALSNPGIDLNGIAAEMGVARSKDVIMKSGIAEMIPDLLAETVKAGKALKYSDAQFAGKAQKWMKGQLNDPKLVEYMTLRNDQLLTLGGVMRSNGMTDMAQRLEEEAAHPTMSPRALEGWLNGQLKSIDPRLSLYRKLTKGNTAIPRSTYNPGDGAQKLLNQHGKAPSGGRFKILKVE